MPPDEGGREPKGEPRADAAERPDKGERFERQERQERQERFERVAAERAAGRATTRSGEHPASRSGEHPASRSGEHPATRSGEPPATRSGEHPVAREHGSRSGEYAASRSGEHPVHDRSADRAHRSERGHHEPDRHTDGDRADRTDRADRGDRVDDEGPADRSARGRLEQLLPDVVRRTLYAGMGALFTTEEGIRKVAGDFQLPKDVANYLIAQAGSSKDELFRIVAKELRAFLESANLSHELQKVLTSLSFEIKTEIRFIPNDESVGGVKPQVKRDVAVHRDGAKGEREPRKGKRSGTSPAAPGDDDSE